MYVLTHNQVVEKFPYSIGDLRKDNPQVSFPKNPSPELLASYGMFPVVSTGVNYDANLQVATQEGCSYNSEKSRWETSWTVRDMTTEELEERRVSEAAAVRLKRDHLLQETDWVVTKAYEHNEIIPTEWKVYRQALRDITIQEGFPHSITWPIKP